MSRSQRLAAMQVATSGLNYVAYIASLAPSIWYRFNEAATPGLNRGSLGVWNGTWANITGQQAGALGATDAYLYTGANPKMTIPVLNLTTQAWACLVNPAALTTNALFTNDPSVFQHCTLAGTQLWSQVKCATTIAEAISAAGFLTGTIGKWCWIFMDYDDTTKHIRLWKYVAGGVLTAATLATDTAGVGAVTACTAASCIGANFNSWPFSGLYDEAIMKTSLWTVAQMQKIVSLSRV